MSTLLSPTDDPSRAPSWNSVHAAAMELLPRSLRLLGVAEPDVDDLAQEVLLAAYESLDRFDPAYPAASPPPPQAQRASPAPRPRPELPPARSHPDAAPAAVERLQIEARLGAVLGLGITPGPAAGMTLSFGVRRPDWSIAVEGRGLVSLAQEVEAMALGKRAFTAAALACHRGRTLFACGVVTAGVVRFVPRDPWNVLSPTQPLLGIGSRFGSAWPVSDRWSVSAYAEAVWIVADAVLRRQRDGSEPPPPLSWSSPPIGAALGFGVTATY
ncbi:hypothetical protein WME98_51325 [Sorangium sp. So ce296]|uniref:hypothetical protein n=1 Tax=Sorangium sp. So ce296 TaxID=3133296 RepID=UPI003F60E741